jgi:hypothetical protein
MYNINKNYFQEIDSKDKAYFLGLMYADGNVGLETYVIQISLQEEDKYILEIFKKYLQSNHKLFFENNNNKNLNWKNSYKLHINCKKLHDDLIINGCIPQKCFNLKFPILSKELIPHFLRGYFDGDGCIWQGQRKWMIMPKRSKIIHNVKTTFTGNINFIEQLRNVLVENYGFSNVKINNHYKNKNSATLEYSGRNNAKKFYDLFYSECDDLFLIRKKEKFEEIFCALNEKSLSETGLIAGKPEMVISSQAVSNTEGSSTIPEMEVELSNSKCPALNE